MSLVKSKGLRNSGNITLYKTRVCCLLSPLLIVSNQAFAEAKSLSNPTSIVSIFLSLLLVVGIVFMLAFIMRRFNVTHAGSGQLKVVASMMAGTKERVVVIKVGDEQHLIGITSANINHLAKLEQPLQEAAPSPGVNFKDKLTQALAEKINPGSTASKGVD